MMAVIANKKVRTAVNAELSALKKHLIKRELIKIDEALYPRYSRDPAAATAYAEAMRAGAQFPLIKLDQHNRLIDGVHRYLAYELNGVELIPYEREVVKDDVDFFQRAMTANAHHGRRYTGIDYAHMLLRGRELGLADDDIARLVYVTPGFLEEATRDWFALNSKSESVALKRTIRHMHGRKLTSDQMAANKKLGGMQQSFYVNQVLLLLENDLVDLENVRLIERLTVLQEALGQFFLGLAKRQRSA